MLFNANDKIRKIIGTTYTESKWMEKINDNTTQKIKGSK